MGCYKDKASRDILICCMAAEIIVTYLYISGCDVDNQNEV